MFDIRIIRIHKSPNTCIDYLQVCSSKLSFLLVNFYQVKVLMNLTEAAIVSTMKTEVTFKTNIGKVWVSRLLVTKGNCSVFYFFPNQTFQRITMFWLGLLLIVARLELCMLLVIYNPILSSNFTSGGTLIREKANSSVMWNKQLLRTPQKYTQQEAIS